MAITAPFTDYSALTKIALDFLYDTHPTPRFTHPAMMEMEERIARGRAYWKGAPGYKR